MFADNIKQLLIDFKLVVFAFLSHSINLQTIMQVQKTFFLIASASLQMLYINTQAGKPMTAKASKCNITSSAHCHYNVVKLLSQSVWDFNSQYKFFS